MSLNLVNTKSMKDWKASLDVGFVVDGDSESAWP
jgi:hypothetical protein